MNRRISNAIIRSLFVFFPFTAWAVRPPQYVAVSFDGSKRIPMWQITRELSLRSGARFTYFLSGVYFLSDKKKKLYHPPQRPAGQSDIGFGGTEADISNRLYQVYNALLEGAEVGSHVNGHFDGSRWEQFDWQSEFTQFHNFILDVFLNNPNLQANSQPKPNQWKTALSGQLRGFRAPLLAINKNSDRILEVNKFLYDASRVAPMNKWPYKIGSVWQFPLAEIPVVGTHKKSISMDYNFYYTDSKAIDDLDNAPFFEDRYYKSLLNYFQSNYYGNRAPIHIGNHFSTWNGGAYFRGLMRFIDTVCLDKNKYPEVECLNYQSLVEKMDQTSAESLAKWDAGEFDFLIAPERLIPENIEQPDELGLELINYKGDLQIKLTNPQAKSYSNQPKIQWALSYWPITIPVDNIARLGLPTNKSSIKEVRFTDFKTDLSSFIPADGTFVVRYSVWSENIEIQSISKKIYLKNGKVTFLNTVSEESISLKGDPIEAHLDEE